MADFNPLKGADPESELFCGSYGEYLYAKMLNQPQDNACLVDGLTGENVTVAEILEDSLAVAASLEERGVQAGDVIAIIGDFSRRYFALSLGALFHNAVVFPINASYKHVELNHLLKNGQPKMVFTDRKVAAYVLEALNKQNVDAQVVFLNISKDEPINDGKRYEEVITENGKKYKLKTVTNPDAEPVLISNSSGTTGLPKVLQLSHTNLLYGTQVVKNFPFVRERLSHMFTIVGGWTTVQFIMYQCFAFGQKMVYVTDATETNIMAAIEKQRPEWTLVGPKRINTMLTMPQSDQYDLSSLKRVVLAGSAVIKNLETQIKKRLPYASVSQSFGISECGGYVCEPFCEAPFESAGKLVQGMECKIVNLETGGNLGPNEVGELRFRSRQIFLGYKNNPEANREAFDDEGFYRSGDIGTITDQGFMYIQGRIKEMILTQYGRVTNWVIEDWIGSIEGVADVAVVGVPYNEWYCRLAAAVITTSNSSVTPQQIKLSVKENFADCCNLEYVEIVDELPRNLNGKIVHRGVLEMMQNLLKARTKQEKN